MNPLYRNVALRAEHHCEYCRAPEAAFNFPFEVDHIVPRAEGGSSDSINLALACRSCNAFKAHRMFVPIVDGQAAVALYHPRHHRWSDHFNFDVETFELHGVSLVGEATISALNMNNAWQIAARREWARLDLFP
jgi:hypothetical protein